ncbi:hypothetical protein EZH22_13965 [Xanthobacter dioxanivorans]|uniref:Uncharacterized protein n=1 Tax=Xanthobacter dioxanivorans TaxID=2528964 RepID=A0A974PTS6_9HYPH|nr:hypothetical protein [Xanthobacter dioxanivorans]QRG09259.1 hypothetical protein EZH22_13965 [Xanthobacter dioxanivorans]
MPNPTVPAVAPGLPAITESHDAILTMIDRMENGLLEVRDLAHAVFIIAGAMPWDEAQAAQRVAGLIMDRAEELKKQRTAVLKALHSLPADAGEASNG